MGGGRLQYAKKKTSYKYISTWILVIYLVIYLPTWVMGQIRVIVTSSGIDKTDSAIHQKSAGRCRRTAASGKQHTPPSAWQPAEHLNTHRPQSPPLLDGQGDSNGLVPGNGGGTGSPPPPPPREQPNAVSPSACPSAQPSVRPSRLGWPGSPSLKPSTTINSTLYPPSLSPPLPLHAPPLPACRTRP